MSKTISVHNMFSPCSPKRRASDKDLPVIHETLNKNLWMLFKTLGSNFVRYFRQAFGIQFNETFSFNLVKFKEYKIPVWPFQTDFGHFVYGPGA